MITRSRFVYLLLIVSVLFLIGLDPSTRASAMSREEAIARAFQYTGLGVQPDVTVSAQATTVPADDDVPFLRLAGRAPWRVTFDNVTLVVRGRGGKTFQNPTIHRLEVWLDSADGRLLGIASPLPEGVDALTVASLADREHDLQGGSRRLEGLPAEMLRMSFLETLRLVTDEFGGTSLAKQVEGL